MINLFRYLLFFILFGLLKAHGRLLILSILGLTGLWMAHLLAQDYQRITSPRALISSFGKLISKRSIETYRKEINWNDIANHDRFDCIKSFVCQTVAQNIHLNTEQAAFLQFIKNLPRNTNTNDIRRSIKIGESFQSVSYCQHIYHKCPYTVKNMSRFMRIFGRS